MASEEQQETVEEKKAFNESIDLQAIHNPITTESKKGQMEIKSDVLDENIVNKEGDLVKEEIEVPSKLGIFVEPNQIITEKPESLEKCTEKLEGELKEHEVLRHEEAVSPLEKPTALEQQEKVNGETENELYSTQFTEQLSPELVLKGDAIPANVTSILSDEVQEKTETEEVTKENGHQNQISEKDQTEKDAILVSLPEKDYQKEVELPIGNTSQNPEEDVTNEVELPSSTAPLVEEEVLEEAKEENGALEEVQKEQIHQIETAKETMAEEKECPDKTEDQNRNVSVVVTPEETIPEEASQLNQTPEMICEEVKQTEDPTLYDQPITIEETGKSDERSEHMSEEVKENDVPTTTPLISEETEESADIKEDTKEEAHQDQILKEDETGEDANQSTSVVYLPEKPCENETEKTIENASGNPEEEVSKEVESVSSVTPPVSEEVLEEAKEKIDAVEEVQSEQASKENLAEEKECPAEAKVQNRDVSEETMPEEASPEKETPEMISEEVEPSDVAIDMAEKDETRQNDNEENAVHKDITSSHPTIANVETSKTNESSEHISEKSTLESVTTRDIAPEIEIKDAETEALTSEIDDRNIEKLENEEEGKSPEEVKLSESKDAPMEIVEETLNDFEEEKSGDNKSKQKETDDEKEVKSCFTTEEQLDESKAPPSEEDISAEKNTTETKPIKVTEGDEQNVAQNEITSGSKETFSNDDDVVNYDEKDGQAMEMHTDIVEEHNANNDINGDELGEGNGKDDEANKGNVEEISEPTELVNNTEALIDAEIQREEIELQSDNPVSAQLSEGEEALQDTPCESTTLSEMDKENKGSKAIENSHEDDPNELPDKADKGATASEDHTNENRIKEDGKVDINENEEVEQKLEVEEKTEENLFDNIEHEIAPTIQNEENPSEKDENIKNEIIDENQSSIDDDKVDTERLEPGIESYLHVSSITLPISQEESTGTSVTEGNSDDAVLQNSNELEREVESTSEIHCNEEDPIIKEQCVQDEPKSSDVEGSTEVTEAPEEDGLKISSNDNEFETEKLEIGEALSQEEEKPSVLIQNDDELDLKLPEEKIEAETLSNEEITQILEEVEEPSITHNKEELPEAKSTIEFKETSNKPSISTIQQDPQSEVSDAMPTEANQSTDDTSVEDGSETNRTLISSTEQIDERSITKDEGDKMQEEIIVAETLKEETEGESTEKQIEEIPQITNPREVPEVDLSQSDTAAPETENLEVVSDEKFGDESKSADTDSQSVELESVENELTKLKESSIEHSNAREAQIDQLSLESDVKPTEPDKATDEVSAQQNSEVDATLSASEEQIGEESVAQEESVILQEEDLKMSKDDAEMIEAAANEKHIEEEIPQIVHPSEITEEQLVKSEVVGSEAEHLEIVSNEKFGDESKLTETDLKSAQMESTPDELIEEKWNANLSSSERSVESEVLLQNTGERVQREKSNAEMPKEEICQAIEAAEEPCDKHIEGEILKTADSEICNAAEEKEVDPQNFETQTESPEQEKVTDESASVEEKSDATAILVPSEGHIEEKENAINESYAVPQSTTESVIEPEEKISQGVETNEEPSDMVMAGEIPQIIPTSEIAEKQLVESEIVGPDAEHLEVVSNEKFGDENKLSETDSTSGQMENTLDELIKEKSTIDLSASVEQISERSEESEGFLQNTGEQVQGEKSDAEMPKEKMGQSIEVAEASCDKHREGEICTTRDLEIFDAAEESKAILTEMEVDPQKFGTETESPELEKSTEESASVEEKSDATAIIVPGEGQIEEIEIANRESSGVPQSTTESVIVSEEKNSQVIETNDEPSDKDISVQSSEIANPEIHDVAVQSTIVSNDEDVDSEKLGTEIESTELEKATEESTLVEKKSDAGADLVPSEGQLEEIEFANKESSVAPQSTVELVTVPEENVSQGIETNEVLSDKHIVGEIHEKDISIDNFEAAEEINLVLEDKVDQGQTTASPVELPDSKNVRTEMESAFLDKTNGDIDIKANLEKTTVTSFVEDEGAVINQTDNGSETVPIVEQTHEEEAKLIDTVNNTETEELQVQEEALDTVVTEPENETKVEDLIRTETKEEISEIETVGQEKDIPTEFLKTAEEKVVAVETNEDTEETVPNSSEQNKEVEEAYQSEGPEESASVEEKSNATAIIVLGEGQIEEIENAINESNVVPQSTTESVIEPEEKISRGVETNEEPSDMVMAGEIPQIIPTSEITEKQLVESEIGGPDAEHLEIVSNEKFGDENKLSETDSTSGQMENTLDELIKEKSTVNLSASVEQISERSEESEGFLQNTGEQVQGEKPDAEMPKEEIGQSIEAAEAPCDKHIEGEICTTRDLEIFDAAEELKAILTEMEVDPQKFRTETESPELEKATEESASVEEKSDATAIIVPGEGQIEEIEIANKESSGVPQSTTESVIVSEEKNSQVIETNDEPSDKDISVQGSEIANPEIHDVAVQSTIVSNDEEVDSEKLGTEIESTELEKATEESTSVEKKSDAGAGLVPSEGQLEEIEFANKESSVAPQSTVELVTVPEENVSQGIETNEELSDKHIVGEIHERDISIDNFEAAEEINLVLEDKVDQGQTTASPVEQPDSKNVRTEMESTFLEKTNGDIDVKANLEKTTITSFVEDGGAVINQTDNGSETVPIVEQTHEEEAKLIDTVNNTETEELQVQEEALDTVVTEPENQTKDEDLIRTETKEEISKIETVGQEKDILTEFLKTAEEKVVTVETNEDTEETVPNSHEQNKKVEEEAYQSEGPEDRDFASIVSSFLISKVLSEENPRTDDGAKQNNDASFIPKPLDEETISEITTDKKEPETADEEISYATSLREEEKPEIQEREEENGEKKTVEDGEGDGVEQDYLPVSRFLMDKILRQEENKNLGEGKAIEETDKQLITDDGTQVEEKMEYNSNPVVEPEQKGETPSSFAEVARDFEKEETLIKMVDDTFVGDGGISIEEKTKETSSVAALPKQEGEGSHSSIEVARDFEEKKPADNALKPVEDKNKTEVSDVGILSVEKNEEVNRSVGVVTKQEGEKNISPIEVVRDFEKEDKIIEQKNEGLVTNEGISIIEKFEDNTGEETRDFDKDVKPAEIKDESLVSVDGACTPKNIKENYKVALDEQEGETEPSVVKEVDGLASGEQNKDLEEILVNPHEFLKPEKIIDENKSVVTHEEEEQTTELIADEETLIDSKDVEENYVLVEREVDQFEESKEVPMPLSDATIPNLEKKQNNLSAEIQDVERNLVQQVEITENSMKNSSASSNEIEESLPDIPQVPMAGVKTEAILQEPLEKQRDLEATENRKELVGNETDYTRGEEQVKEVTGTVVERTQNKNQELTETEATKIEKKSEEIKDEGHKEEGEEEEGKHQDETEIIGRDLTVKTEAKETEMKSAQKKSHNILSGVGSKVKHSLAKVKKAITGKSKNVSPSAK